MLKIIIGIIVIIGLGCAVRGVFHLRAVAARNQQEMAAYFGEKPAYTASLGKTLVIYYSKTGHTQAVAQRVAQYTGGELYAIETQKPFSNVPWLALSLRRQLKSGQYPVLKEPLPDVSAYDTVFVGAPVWWYTAATPLLAFLQQMDFKGKAVVFFSTQGSNYGTYFKDVRAKAKNARLLPGAAFNNLDASYDAAVDNKILTWLNGLQTAPEKEVLVGEQFHHK